MMLISLSSSPCASFLVPFYHKFDPFFTSYQFKNVALVVAALVVKQANFTIVWGVTSVSSVTSTSNGTSGFSDTVQMWLMCVFTIISNDNDHLQTYCKYTNLDKLSCTDIVLFLLFNTFI